MEEITVIAHKWAVITEKMVTKTINTPQGQQIIQQPQQVALVFRSQKEIEKYIGQQIHEERDQIILQRVSYDMADENKVEFYYK